MTTLHPGPTADRTGVVTAGLMIKYAAPAAVRGEPVDAAVSPAPVAANFADPFGRREYPIHTPAAAWASAARYHDTGSDDPAVAARLKEACDRHRLFGEWDRLKAARAEPAAPPPPAAYALPAAKKYPVDTAEQVKAAAAYFSSYADQFDPQDRREFAANTAKAAAAFPGAVDAPTLSRLQAEGGFGRLAKGWKTAFEVRARMAELTGEGALAAAIKAAAAAAPADPVAAVILLRRVDKAAGWAMTDPQEAVIDLTPAKAAEELKDAVRAADGTWYRKSALAAVPDATLCELFGAPPVASAAYREGLLKAADTSTRFREVLADHGVEPAAVPKARPDWKKLAAG